MHRATKAEWQVQEDPVVACNTLFTTCTMSSKGRPTPEFNLSKVFNSGGSSSHSTTSKIEETTPSASRRPTVPAARGSSSTSSH